MKTMTMKSQFISKNKATNMQTTPKIKLTYFNGKGRTEPARLILAYAGVDYEDCRIEFEDWPKLKPSKIFQNFNLTNKN